MSPTPGQVDSPTAGTPARRLLADGDTGLGDDVPLDAAREGAPPREPDEAERTPPPSDASPRARIGLYEIVGELGRGGMGAVYKAWHPVRRRHVALKVIHADPIDRRRYQRLKDLFLREAGILTSIAHPNVVRCYDANEADHGGRPVLYMALELCDGETLEARLERGPLGLEEALRIARGLAHALSALHRNDPPILHRDLKPANVFVTSDGTVKLLDFGLAAIADWRLAHVSVFAAGSRPYMAPEQFEGLRHCTERSDLYSLGVTLFQAATGRCPFEATSDHGYRKAHRDQSPPRLVEAREGLERDPLLEAAQHILTRLLAKRADERHESADALAAEIDRAIGGEAIETPRVTRPETIRLRRRLARAALVALVLAIAALVGRFGMRSRIPQRIAHAEGLVRELSFPEARRAVDALLADAPENQAVQALAADLVERLGRRDALRARAAASREASSLRARAIGLKGALEAWQESALFRPDELAALDEEARAAESARREALDAELRAAREEVDAGRLTEARERLRLLAEDPSAHELTAARAPIDRDLEEALAIDRRLREAAALRADGRAGDAALAYERIAGALEAGGASLERRVGRTAGEARARERAAEGEAATARARAAAAAGDPRASLAEAVRALALLEGTGAPQRTEAERLVAEARRAIHARSLERARRLAEEPERLAEAEAAARDALAHLPDDEATLFRTVAAIFEVRRRGGSEAAARQELREMLRDLRAAEAAWLVLEAIVAARGLEPGWRLVGRHEGVTLGSEDSEAGNPVHVVHAMPPYYIAATEVDAESYAQALAAAGLRAPAAFEAGGRPRPGTGHHPVRGISFDEAQAYAAHRGARLPTADEWEVAASVEADGRRRLYPWGDAWLGAAAGAAPRPVGSFEADRSPAGCLDMGSNVQEWTTERTRGESVPTLCGGSFLLQGFPSEFRAARRSRPVTREGLRFEDAGVRLARDAPAPDLAELSR